MLVVLQVMKNNFDTVFVTETHLIKGTRFSLPDFIPFHNPRSSHDDVKPHSGISCFIKPTALSFVDCVEKNIPENIVIEWKGGHKIFGSYIVPSDSPYSDSSVFSNIANFFVPVSESRVVIGGGDLNARVGDIKQKLHFVGYSYRENQDKIVNDYGKSLLRVCNSFNCFIINNLDACSKHFD